MNSLKKYYFILGTCALFFLGCAQDLLDTGKNPPVPEAEYYQLLASGSQAGCSGFTNANICNKYIYRLNEKSPRGVYFHQNANISHVEGGTCSAKTLYFIKKVLKYPMQSAHKYYTENFSYFQRASAKDKNIQAALNQISLNDRQNNTDSAHLLKINALLGFYNLNVIEHSEVYDLNQEILEERAFEKLAEGVYFARMIMFENNEKLEKHGHSLALVKMANTYFVYEPNTGLHKTNSEQEIWKIMRTQHSHFNLPELRLYRVTHKQQA